MRKLSWKQVIFRYELHHHQTKNMKNNVSIYIPHISQRSHGGLQFCKEPEGEIGRQHIEYKIGLKKCVNNN